MGKKRNIVVVEPASTGFNLIDDVKARGYQPVAVIAPSLGTDEDREVNREFVEKFLVRLPKEVPVIGENPNYEEVLEEVRKYDPLLVIPGSDFGVELATRLGSDLGLRGNKWANIGRSRSVMWRVCCNRYSSSSTSCVREPVSIFLRAPTATCPTVSRVWRLSFMLPDSPSRLLAPVIPTWW